MHHALSGARELRRPEEAVLILSDSQLAICTTTGAWASRKHKALVARNRKALAQLRADGADVKIQHVRAHTGHGMNERADELAAQGAQEPIATFFIHIRRQNSDSRPSSRRVGKISKIVLVLLFLRTGVDESDESDYV